MNRSRNEGKTRGTVEALAAHIGQQIRDRHNDAPIVCTIPIDMYNEIQIEIPSEDSSTVIVDCNVEIEFMALGVQERIPPRFTVKKHLFLALFLRELRLDLLCNEGIYTRKEDNNG